MKQKYLRIIKNHTVLITGGTGSFGNYVISTLLEMDPKKIIILSRDELKQFEMRNKFNDGRLSFVIGDVRDLENIERIFEGVDYVFHAAALKQVPSCEFFPMEAVKTNIVGTHNVLTAAKKSNVKRVVVLSTDKSVYPINAMGLSKAMMEKVMVAESRSFLNGANKTVFCGVRYGNVLYTRGSVLPYFVGIIKENKKIPVTNLESTRFLLPLEDAVDLVLFALAEGENGYIYVRKSPATTMRILTQALCNVLSYKEGYQEMGLRAGEKKHETLLTSEESIRATKFKNYFKIPPQSQGLDYNQYLYKNKKSSRKAMPFTSDNAYRLDLKETEVLLRKIPEIQTYLKSK